MESAPPISSKLLAFGDYVVIGAMVLSSIGVGLYYGITKKKQSSPYDYFLGGRQMALIPVAFSAFATGLGPSTLLGMPTESYNFGMQIVWWFVVEILIAFINNEIFIPLYYKMDSMNVFKFLEVRYNSKTKNVATTVAALGSTFQCSNGLFATSLTLSRVTNIDIWIIIGTITGLCVLYTSVGGIKSVIWADVIQAVVMAVSVLTIVVVGLISVGGVKVVWQRSYDSERLDIFDFNTDPAARHTFWTSTVGYFFHYLAGVSTSQLVLQRYLTTPTIEDAKRANMVRLVMNSSTTFLIQIIGLLMYAEYYSCDPIRSKSIQSTNQLVPTFMMKVMGKYPFFPGIFCAGLLATNLSTLSSVYNSVSAVLYESFVKALKPNMPMKQANIICKILCVAVGILSVASILVTKNFPNVKQGSMSVGSMLSGSLMVLIFFGLIFPQANFKAALLALLSGISISAWIVIGGLLVQHPQKTKPLSIQGCLVRNTAFSTTTPSNFSIANNITKMNNPISPWAEYFPLYFISYIWIATIGIIVSSTVFIIMSQVFEKEQSRSAVVDVIPDALQNLHRRFSKRWRKALLCDVYDNERKHELKECMEKLPVNYLP